MSQFLVFTRPTVAKGGLQKVVGYSPQHEEDNPAPIAATTLADWGTANTDTYNQY
jgi:hypothetical protein